ncbi:unnamed protein product [Phytophthora fragariaefolia]|uniref:Unnamed protein product n=1 Tax=Phytophthora fragariaefolia TaxID=1490495 RepID=A0A9W7D459_9STRA|nr:unnamed protein product [Phytophthora fragariaefolia]
MLQQLALAAALFQASFVFKAAGHGNIFDPKPEGTGGDYTYYFGDPAGSIDMPDLVGDASYGEYYQGVDNWFTKNKIKSVKDFVTTYGSDIAECGNTKKNGTPQPVPTDGYAKHDTLGNSHPGPCEIWCDDTRVFHNINCAGEYAGQVPTKLPIDVSTCKASSHFVFYWLALHGQPWQVYINCVTLDGKADGSLSSTNSTSTRRTKAPVVTPAEASVAGEALDEEDTTETPVVTNAPIIPATQAPVTTTAPSTSSSKCLRRRP